MDILRAHGVALVIADRPEIHDFQTRELTADFTYVRFHHGTRGRRGNYSPAELSEWTKAIRRWASDVEVYAYFNNDWEAFAVANAETMRSLLTGRRGTSGRSHAAHARS
jgi:uncharacterized protein YecE (DUF72 family)